jgi:hypothetical protein
MPVGSTAVVADVDEPAVEVIDGEMGKLDGKVARRHVDVVMAELLAAEDAANAAGEGSLANDARGAQSRVD